MPDYQNWKAFSGTERFDNHTMRVILGNEIAIRAIAAGQIDPWPDGAAFAKVAWDQLTDNAGRASPGAFKQVEFITKDAKKYASTLGWGWARWLGTDLKPYGKDANFAAECVGCHRPLAASDHVFTIPVKAPPNLSDYEVVSSVIDRQAGTMSILFGNGAAIAHARTSTTPDYPAGSVLSFVTWAQQDDKRWFGARVPDSVKSVETIRVEEGPDHKPIFRYEGSQQDRMSYVLGQRAAVMP